MFRAKSITERPIRVASGLIVCTLLGGLATSSISQTNPPGRSPLKPVAPAPSPVPAPAPRSPAERLFVLDQLQGELEVAKLRRDLAKVQAEERDAKQGIAAPAPATGPTASLLTPPLPSQGVFSAMPPVGPSVSEGRSPAAGTLEPRSAPSVSVVEAWGAGADRQARIRTSGGDRIVRPGDTIGSLRVVDITGGQVLVRNARGRVSALN